MISLAMSKTEAKQSMACMPCDGGEGPLYPYGTSLCLDDETLKKLGISELPKVGTTFMLVASVTVTGARANARQGETELSLDLQITDMELGVVGKTDDERAAKLYDKKK